MGWERSLKNNQDQLCNVFTFWTLRLKERMHKKKKKKQEEEEEDLRRSRQWGKQWHTDLKKKISNTIERIRGKRTVKGK